MRPFLLALTSCWTNSSVEGDLTHPASCVATIILNVKNWGQDCFPDHTRGSYAFRRCTGPKLHYPTLLLARHITDVPYFIISEAIRDVEQTNLNIKGQRQRSCFQNTSHKQEIRAIQERLAWFCDAKETTEKACPNESSMSYKKHASLAIQLAPILDYQTDSSLVDPETTRAGSYLQKRSRKVPPAKYLWNGLWNLWNGCESVNGITWHIWNGSSPNHKAKLYQI